MSSRQSGQIAVIGIEIGKNFFHVVGLDKRLRVLFVQAAWVVLVKPKI